MSIPAHSYSLNEKVGTRLSSTTFQYSSTKRLEIQVYFSAQGWRISIPVLLSASFSGIVAAGLAVAHPTMLPSPLALPDNPSTSPRRPEYSSERKVSSTSSFSKGNGPLRQHDENDRFLAPQTPRHESPHGSNQSPVSRERSGHISRRSSWGTVIPPPPHQDLQAVDLVINDLEEVNLASGDDSSKPPTLSTNNADLRWTLNILSDDDQGDCGEPVKVSAQDDRPGPDTEFRAPRQPLRRWASSLGQRLKKNKAVSTPNFHLPKATDGPEPSEYVLPPTSRGNRSSSMSSNSLGLTNGGTRRARSRSSLGLASLRTGVAFRRRRWRDSTESGNSTATLHEEMSTRTSERVYSDTAAKRAVQRQQVIDELMHSEEGYIADLKVLVNVCEHSYILETPCLLTKTQVYFKLLASVPTLLGHVRVSIHRNLVEILSLHEELLSRMRMAVSQHEEDYTRNLGAAGGDKISRSRKSLPRHEGDTSSKRNRERKLVTYSNQFDTNATSAALKDPRVAGRIAEIFNSLV